MLELFKSYLQKILTMSNEDKEMKRILALLLLISSVLALSACDISGNDGIAEGVYTLVGHVVKVDDSSFTLAVTEGDSKGIDHIVKLTSDTDYIKERDSNLPFVFQDWRDAEFFKTASL